MSNKTPRRKTTRLKKQLTPRGQGALPPEVVRALRHVGLFARVADENGWSRSHVLQVAKGIHQSQKVLDAIIEEVEKIERDCEGAA